jgi:hypothetical protein
LSRGRGGSARSRAERHATGLASVRPYAPVFHVRLGANWPPSWRANRRFALTSVGSRQSRMYEAACRHADPTPGTNPAAWWAERGRSTVMQRRAYPWAPSPTPRYPPLPDPPARIAGNLQQPVHLQGFCVVRPEGIEPSACGLKDRCSLAPRREPLTTELRALVCDGAYSTHARRRVGAWPATLRRSTREPPARGRS